MDSQGQLIGMNSKGEEYSITKGAQNKGMQTIGLGSNKVK